MATLGRGFAVLDPETLTREASPETRERLWLVEHFKVLPTDERYLKLSDGQVSLLFNAWLASPSEDDLKRFYWENQEGRTKPMPEEDELEDIGYSEEEIEAIKAELNRG